MKQRYFTTILCIAGAAIIVGVVLYLMYRPRPNPHELVLYGNVDVRQVDIGFRVPGQITAVFFEEGDRVAQGSLVAVLDKTPYNHELQQATANLETVRINLHHAEILLNRRLELIEIGGVSQEDLDNAQANYDASQAGLIQAEEAVAIARDNLIYTEAFAPTDAILLTRIREPGTVVNPADPVCTLSITSPVWIRAFIDEPFLGKIYYGMQALVYTDIEGNHPYTGRVGFISPVAEFTPKTVETTTLRTDLVYRLRIYADNPDHHLLQGMPVTIKLQI